MPKRQKSAKTWQRIPLKNLVPFFKVMFQVVGENYGCKIISEPLSQFFSKIIVVGVK